MIDILSKYVVNMLAANHFKSRFVATCSETITTQVQEGMVVSRNDLKSFQEEANVNIVKQCMSCAMEKKQCIKVICEDTDVFVLNSVCIEVLN